MDLYYAAHVCRKFYLTDGTTLIYFEAVIAVNLLILAASWFILRRDRFSDFRSNILFMAGLTIINILTDLGILTHSMSWVAFGALLIWSMTGGGRSHS